MYQQGQRRRIGVDLGGVVIGGSSATQDTMFGSTYLETPAVPGAFAALSFLSLAGHAVFVVSKCGPKVEQHSREWLAARQFAYRTGVYESRWHFCRDRADKAGIARRLHLDAFVDDRWDVIESVGPVVSTAVVFAPKNPAGTRFTHLDDGVVVASSWHEVLAVFADG